MLVTASSGVAKVNKQLKDGKMNYSIVQRGDFTTAHFVATNKYIHVV